jgi:hypothetical protein
MQVINLIGNDVHAHGCNDSGLRRVQVVPALLARVFFCIAFQWNVKKLGYLQQVMYLSAFFTAFFRVVA